MFDLMSESRLGDFYLFLFNKDHGWLAKSYSELMLKGSFGKIYGILKSILISLSSNIGAGGFF